MQFLTCKISVVVVWSVSGEVKVCCTACLSSCVARVKSCHVVKLSVKIQTFLYKSHSQPKKNHQNLMKFKVWKVEVDFSFVIVSNLFLFDKTHFRSITYVSVMFISHSSVFLCRIRNCISCLLVSNIRFKFVEKHEKSSLASKNVVRRKVQTNFSKRNVTKLFLCVNSVTARLHQVIFSISHVEFEYTRSCDVILHAH